jgi:hypothetical protein
MLTKFEESHQPTSESDDQAAVLSGGGLAIGAGVGASIGVALGNIAIGVAIGSGVGIVFGLILGSRVPRD